jgi:type II secretory pathway predicted ATPase ExeA
MFSEVMEFFGLERELDHLGFFETASQKHLEKELKITIAQGRLIAISGIVGSGKTTFLQRLMADLTKSKHRTYARIILIEGFLSC